MDKKQDLGKMGYIVIAFLALVTLSFASSLQTANAWYGQGNEGFWGWVLGSIGLAIDSGKIIFTAIAIMYWIRGNVVGFLVFATATLLVILISFASSCVMDANKLAEIENGNKGASIIRQEQIFNDASASIKTLTLEIAEMKANKPAAIKKKSAELYNLKAVAKKNNWWSTANIGVHAIQKKIDNIEVIVNNDIKTKEATLLKAKTELKEVNEGFSTLGNDKLTTKGFGGFAKMISPKNPAIIIRNITYIKNALIEIFILLFGVSFMVLTGDIIMKTNTKASKWLKKKLEPEIATDTSENRIDEPKQQPRKKDSPPTLFIDNEAVSEFVKLALASHSLKDNSIAGLGTLAKQSNEYTRTELSKAKGMLETKRILEVRGRTTYILDLQGLKRYV